MARIYLYADESGNFDFSRKPSASKYFILTTVRIDNHAIGDELTALRRELAWSGVDLHREFHATEDLQTVRDRVFQVIAAHDFRIDVTLLDKPKTQSHIRATEDRFYKTAWYGGGGIRRNEEKEGSFLQRHQRRYPASHVGGHA